MVRSILATAMLAVVSTAGAQAANVDIKVLNAGSQGGMMVLEPALVRVAPGDTVTFAATDKGHNVESIPGMLPEGAASFTSKMNQDVIPQFGNARQAVSALFEQVDGNKTASN